jgi:hypothetical protein
VAISRAGDIRGPDILAHKAQLSHLTRALSTTINNTFTIVTHSQPKTRPHIMAALCGPTNALAALQKHTTADRSHQQQRFRAAPGAPSQVLPRLSASAPPLTTNRALEPHRRL